jgi:hypothetical protein
MKNIEKTPFERDDNLVIENKKARESAKREKTINAILALKDKSETEPDGVNIHLKGIDRNILLASLNDEDYSAFYEVFISGGWDENCREFREYMERELEWEKKEKMDSGKNRKLLARRNFATMLRAYLVAKNAEKKSEERELER